MRFTFITFMLLGAAQAMSAGVACPNGGTLQQYINLSVSDGGCDVGSDYILSNWAYVNNAVFSTPVTPSDLIVTYSFDGGGVPLISFSGNWLADVSLGTASGVGLLAFSLEARDALFAFTGVNLSATGSVSSPILDISGLVPTGAASVTEVNCIGGLLDLRDSNNLLGLLPLPGNLGDIGCSGGGVEAGATAQLGSGNNVSANALISFGAQDNFVDVLKIITVSDLLSDPLLIDGYAQITNVTQAFAGASTGGGDVPEPATSMLCGAGLLGAVLWQRRTAAKRG